MIGTSNPLGSAYPGNSVSPRLLMKPREEDGR